jgi:2-polyprenyl-3-methyl-5-hydroxy-6-metoxy-1,4-benzoquinol methylase
VLQEIKNCPICSKTELTLFKTVKDHSVSNEKFNITMCKDCGFKFTNPIPTEDTIGKYYQSENYISHSDTNKGIVNKLYHIVRKQALKSKVNLINSISKKGSILDVGCGTGYFLKACQENGWTVTGMEPDATARSHAEKNTNHTIHTNLFSVVESEKFNVITMWHVLEHVHKLNQSIQHIHKLLVSKGKIIIAVPNIKSYDSIIYSEYWAALDVPRHLYHFTEKDIDNLLTTHGFTKEKINPMLFDSFYVSMLSDKYMHGKTNYIRAFYNALVSNLKSINKTNHSSLIYIYQKND